MIPFVDLRSQYELLRPEIDRAIEEVFTNAHFIGGEPVRKFEQAFASLHEVDHCIGTGNGTDSLFIILKALGIKSGDEVITPAFSCIPSAECITLAGGTAVFADVDDRFYVLDAADVERKITPRTKAVIAVHLYGQVAPVQQLKSICDKHGIYLIEDCAQAHLSYDDQKPAGTFGIASAFSFYPTKNLGAYGDAGCILTRDSALAGKMRKFANHGSVKKDVHEMEGTNSRLDVLQAAILSVKLGHLKKFNTQRSELASQYLAGLKDVAQITLPHTRTGTTHSFHIFAIRTKQRNELKDYLAEAGIETLIHYPHAIPFTPAYHYKNHAESDFPVSASLQHEVLSLPVYPELTNNQVTAIIENIRNYFLR